MTVRRSGPVQLYCDVSRALIEELYRYAADGAERVYWHTHHTNARARRLYDTLAIDSGFIVYRKNL
ncbi:hypothetical protein HBDW_15420 [Herbaspirillum sp. DW155]|nr:hypothetical protein HBDW_15420 [Herbaspirillum sp. DW155]